MYNYAGQNRGSVMIYFGGNGTTNSPDVVIQGTADFMNLGWNLEKGDADGDGHDDLLIGSKWSYNAGPPAAGHLGVFLSSATRYTCSSCSGTQYKTLTVENADLSLNGESAGDQFGSVSARIWGRVFLK